MNLSEISWPVFRLGEHPPIERDGVLFYSKEYSDIDTQAARVSLRVVDDITLPAKTLGKRRLLLAAMPNKPKMFKIKTAVYFLADLIKLAKPTTWFIDSNGKPFQYRKSTRAKLTFHKIKKIMPGQATGAVVEVEGIPTRFKCMYHPKPEHRYAGVLRWGLGYFLYGFYEHELKPSHRYV